MTRKPDFDADMAPPVGTKHRTPVRMVATVWQGESHFQVRMGREDGAVLRSVISVMEAWSLYEQDVESWLMSGMAIDNGGGNAFVG